MFPYLALAASVFVVIKAFRYFVEAPSWAWFFLSVALSIGGAWLLGDFRWGLAVTFATGIFFRFDTLLQSAADACRVSVVRNTRRR